MLSFVDDWRCDQYRWVNQGVRQLPRKDQQVKKSYFQISTQKGPSSEFVKHAYQLLPPNNPNIVLIHYIGNEKAAVTYAHGNAKRETEGHMSEHAHPSYVA